MSNLPLQHHQNGVYVAQGDALGVPVVQLEHLGRPGLLVDVGLIRVDDAEGRINGFAPGTAQFVQAVVQQGRWQKLVASYQGVGAFHDQVRLDGQYYIFGMVEGADFEAVQDNREYGRLWWSTSGRSSSWEAGGKGYVGWRVYSFQDPDVVLQLRQSSQSMGTALPGLGRSQYWQAGQSYQLQFTMEGIGAGNQVREFGLFTVDDAQGRIGNLLPGQRGYAQAALNRRITVVENGQLRNGGVVSLERGRIYSSYQVAGGTAADWFRVNPGNSVRGGVVAYFDRPLDNPDKQEHISWRGESIYLAGGLNRNMHDLRLTWRMQADVRLSNGSTPENVAMGTVVGQLSAVGGFDRYSLVSGVGDNGSFVIEGNQLKWGISPDFEVKNNYRIRVRAVGADGVGVDKDFTITVTDVNEAPFNLTLSNSSTAENVAIGSVIGRFSHQDPDADKNGTYTLVSGFGDNGSFTIAGNELKWGISPDFEQKNSYRIKVRVTDVGGLFTEQEFTISVTDVNEAPLALALSNSSTPENVAVGTVVGTFSHQDPDADKNGTYTLVSGFGDNASFVIEGNQLKWAISPDFESKSSYQIRVRVTDAGGLFTERDFTITVTDVNEAPFALALNNSSTAENVAVGTVIGTFSHQDPDTDRTGTYSLVSGFGDNASFVIEGNQLKWAISPDFESKSSYQIRVRVTDAGGLFSERDFTISVTDVNEAPLALALSNSSTPENVAVGTVVGTFSHQDPDADKNGTYTLVSGFGDNSSFTIAGNELKWGVSPDFESKSSYSIRVRVTDVGGLFTEQEFTISVTDVNEAPLALALSNSSTPENVAVGTVVGTFSHQDPDTDKSGTYSLVNGFGDNSSFSIEGNQLKWGVSPDFEAKNSYSIRVRVTDAGGLFTERDFTITVTDVNEAPFNLSLSPTATAENVVVGTVIGTFSHQDPDTDKSGTYSLVNGFGDNSSFSIEGNQLKWGVSPDFESKSSYQIRVRVTDAGGLFTERDFTITVTDVNEAPFNLSLSPTATAENVVVGTVIGTFSHQDPDTDKSGTYSLVNGFGDNSSFSIEGNQLKWGVSPDFEAKNSYSIRVRVTDAGGLFTERDFTISVTDVNEAPFNLALSNSSTAENVAVGTVIGTFSHQDPDADRTGTYSLVSGFGDNSSFTIVGNQLQWAIVPDFESKSSYSIRVRVTDAGGLFTERNFTITVTDVNEAPVLSVINDQTVDELTQLQLTVTATDPDRNPTLTYSLVNAPAGMSIDGATGRITWTPSEVQDGVYNITVRVSDGQLSDSKSFRVTVNEVNQAPVLGVIDNRTVRVGEQVSFSITATDSDRVNGQPNVLTYRLVGTVPNGVSLNSSTGSFTWTPNAVGDYSFTVEVNDNTGTTNATASRNFSIKVIRQNEAPTDIRLSRNSINENNALNAEVGLLSSIDPNAEDSHTYTLVAGQGDTDNSLFSIDGNRLRIGFVADYENTTTQKREYSIRVRTTDNGSPSLSFEKVFKIRILDVNERPTAITISGNRVAEGSAYGVVVGDLSTTDPDAGQSHSYELVNDAGGRFALGFADGRTRVIVNNGELLDYETARQHRIRIRTTDSGNPALSYEQDIDIVVLNVNEAPVFVSRPVTSAQPGFEYRYVITTTDPEGDGRAIRASGLPSWLRLIDNGDGTALLSGTPSATDGGVYSIQLVVQETSTAERLEAVQNVLITVDSRLKEEKNFSPEQEMRLVLPSAPSVLSFRIKDLSFDETDTRGINDAFEVALVDASSNRSLVFTYGEGKDSFINFTEGLVPVLAEGVSYDVLTGVVSVNLVGVEPGTQAKLIFRLVNNDQDTRSYVEISDIQLRDTQESAPVRGFRLMAQSPVESPSIQFAQLSNVTGSVKANYERTSFTERGKVLHAQFALENIGTYALNGPVVLAVKNLSDASVTLRNADGVTPDGFAYIDLTSYLENGKLDPTQKTALAELVFNNPNEVQFSYELVVLANINRAPKITSNPLLPGRNVAEVVAGLTYRYAVEAQDPDNDTLSYRLLVAPDGLAINSSSGLIEWQPAQANIGNHSIVVEVSDGRGGIDIQTYTLSVIDTPPNRPPIFTTDPVVDAYINQLYQYDSEAVDPDQDEVTYSLIIGPNGMTVNRRTGLVEWTPPAALVIGDTVLGRIRLPGENDEFTFSGVAGQKVYFDFLNYTGADSNWSFRVITPSGRQIHSSHMRWNDWGSHTLDETGNYRIVVDAVGDQTGTYAFRVIDPTLVPIIEYDAIINDRLAPGNQDRLYRFTAAQGQRLYLDALHRSSGSVDWYVIDAKNTVIQYSDFGDIEMVMPQSGEYILVARGRAGFTNSVDYTFSLVNPDVITRQINLNEVVEGTIAKKGGRHTLEFNARAGQQVFFDSLDGNADLRYSIIDPFGDLVRVGTNASSVQDGIDIRHDRSSPYGFTFAYDGTYKILVDGVYENTGKYKFQLIDENSATSYAVNELLEGTLGFNATESRLFKFTITPNTSPNHVDPNQRQYVYFDGLTSAGSQGAWIVYDSNGKHLNSARLWEDREMWLAPGEYYVLMLGYSADPNYRFRVITSDTNQSDITSKITNKETVEGNIAKKGSFDTYIFTGTAGQQLFFDALSTNYLTYDLISPNGTVLIDDADIRNDRFFLDGFTLPTTGTYRLVIASDAREETGTYKFRLLDMSSAEPYILDTVIDETSGNGGYNTDLYSFDLSDTTYLYFDATPHTQWWLAGDWQLFNDSGAVITSGRLWEDREISLGKGKYILAMRGYGAGYEPRYKFSVITPESTTSALTFNTPISGQISEKGEWDTYTFTASAGDQIFFDSLDGNADLRYTIYNPQGTVIVSQASIRSDRRFNEGGMLLNSSGQYRLVVDGIGEATGNYKFQLLNKASAETLNLNTNTTGNFTDSSTSAKLYKFTLGSRQYVYFDTIIPSGSYGNPNWSGAQTTNWRLYNPNGTEILNKRLWEDDERWLDAGEYTIVMEGWGTSYLSDYGMRIITPSLTSVPLSFGAVYTDAITEKGEQDHYTFNGTAGQVLYLDLINRGNSQTTRVFLKDQYGRELFNRWVSDNDPDAFALSHTGQYTLTFDGDGAKTDSYSFQLLDLYSATNITGNIGKGGAISNITYNGSAYKLSNSIGWEAAQTEARSIGANLVTINDSAEQTFISNNFNANSQYYYIGLTDKVTEGQWKWISGETSAYTNWFPGEPNGGVGENYALMYWTNRWIDLNDQGYRGLIEQTNTAVTITPTTNTDALADGRTTKLYRFNAQQGQAFVFTPVTAPVDTSWTVYAPSGEVLMHGAANTIQTAAIKADGIYTLAIRGNAQATANFSFTVSEIKEASATAPFGTPVNFNQAYSGSISSGQTATFTFTGTAGQHLFYDALGGSSVGLNLFDPYGRQIVSNAGSNSDQRTGFTLASTGTYTLRIGGSGSGSYAFRLIDLNSANNLPVDTDFSGTFTNGGTSAVAYKLNVTERTYYHIDGKAGSGTLFVYSPNGSQVGSLPVNNDRMQYWLDAGEHYFVYAGNGGSSTFTSHVVQAPVRDMGVITFYDQVNNTGTVSGTITKKLEHHYYTFTGTAGQVLMFDALPSTNGLRYRIYDPHGRLVRDDDPYNWSGTGVDINTDNLPDRFTLTTSGTYTIYVISYGGAWGQHVTGNYQFRLFDVTNAQTATLDTTISGTLVNGGSNVYKFNNPTRQYIYVDGQAGSGSWYIYRQDGTQVSSQSVSHDGQFWLDSGDYYLVVQGGSGNYRMRIETPSLTSLPQITYGQVVDDTIDELGEQHYYRFEGKAGDLIYFDSLGSSTPYVTLWFSDKNGRMIVRDWLEGLYSNQDYQPSDTPAYSPTRGLTLLEDGTYYITVNGYFDGNNNDYTGTYKFRLLNLKEAQEVQLDQVITGTFGHGGLGAVTYRFTNPTRQYIFVDGQEGHGDWRIYRADGTKVDENYISQNAQFWLDAGEYYLVASGRAGGTTYKLELVTPELKHYNSPASIQFDTTISDVIDEKGEQHYYSFSGRAGQRIMLDSLRGSPDYIYARIFDPLGRLVSDEWWSQGSMTINDRFPNQGLTLPMDGTYQVVIDGYDDRGGWERTGAYNFRILNLDNKPVVDFDVDISGTFDHSARGAVAYEFNLDRPTYLYFDAKAGDGAWAVYKENGIQVTGGGLWEDRELWLSAGNYSLVFIGYGSNANYNLQISQPDLPKQMMNIGDVISGAITKEGDQHYYTFNGKAGQVLYLDSQTRVNGFRVRITNPSGRSLIGDFDTGSSDDRDFIILDETGEYTLTVDPVNEVMGDYRFRLWEYGDKATMPTAITLNATSPSVTVSGNFGDANRREVDMYRFSSSGKQNLFVDALAGDGANYWGIYKPNGQNLVWGRLTEDNDVYLEEAGQYTLVLWGSGSANNTYEVNLTLNNPSTNAYTIGQVVNSNISAKGESDTYTFNGKAGQVLFFDALVGNNNITAKLYSPSGALVADRNTAQDWLVQLLEDGQYRLVIDGVGATTGNYSFALRDRDSAPVITLGQAVTDTLSVGNGQAVYRINGGAGQVLNFDLVATQWNGANWVLYDPFGVAIAQPNATAPDFRRALPANGAYTLVISGSSSNPVNYSFTVSDVTPTPVTKSGMNVVRSGTFTQANQVDEYTFRANAGTVIWYDSMTGTNDWRERVEILNPDGTRLMEGEARYDAGTYVLQQTGTYTVRLRDYYGQATNRNYKFKIVELPKSFGFGVNYLEPNEAITGTSTEGSAKVFTFQGFAGMQVLFNGMYGTGVNAWIYDSSGNLVWSYGDFRNNDSGIITLSRYDLYNLVIDGREGINDTYSFQLLEKSSSREIEYNLVYNVPQNNSQKSSFFRIHAEAGQRLYFDNLSFNANGSGYPNHYRWQLFSPNGTRVADQEMRYDFEYTVTQTGEYTLHLAGMWETQPYSTSFRVFTTEIKDVNSLDVITPGAGGRADAGDGSLGSFAVTIQAQDDKGATAQQQYTIKLWPQPDNGNPVIISTPETVHSLKERAYSYNLKAVDPDGDELVYRLLDGPNGAFINQDTGELLWFPEASVVNGTQVNFSVEVSDRKGGKDQQTFTVTVYSALGKIQGLVFDDLNGNGFRDSKLIKGENPAIVFAIDVSGSTVAPFYGKGEYEHIKTVLDAQVAAALLLIDSIVAQGAGNKVKIGIIAHEYNASIQDMDLATAGVQLFTTALADSNNNGIRDVEEILKSYTPNGNNRFVEGLRQMEVLVDAYEGTPNLIFMSDGYSRDSLLELQTEGARLRSIIEGKGGNVTSFSVGEASLLETMQAIDPNAILLDDIEELALVFSGMDSRYALEPLKDGVTVYVDLNNNGQFDSNEPYRVTSVNHEPDMWGQVTRYQYEFTDLLPGTYTIRTLGVNGFEVTAPDAEKFTFTVTPTGETFTGIFGIHKITEPVNLAPEFKTQPNTLYRLKAGEMLRYDAIAVDYNGDAVKYDLLLAPEGMTVDPQTGSVVWVPTRQQVEKYYKELRDKLGTLDESRQQTQVVEFQVLLRAMDGKGGRAVQAINVELIPENSAPVFTSVAPDNGKPQVGKQFQYQAKAKDVDGDTLTFSLVSGAPAGVNINSSTGLLTWTPTAGQLGQREFTIRVSDGKGGEALQRVQLEVINPVPNRAPVITSTPRTTIRVETPYYYEIEATDADGDALTYSLVSAPTGMTIQGNLISWVPSLNQSGLNNVQVQVRDSQGGSVTQGFQVLVAHQSTNNAPIITSAPETFVTNLGREYQYNLTGTDPDNDPILWGLEKAPEGMVIDAKTGVLRWRPTATQLGEHEVIVRLTDIYGANVGQGFTLLVTGTNTAPRIISTANTRGAVGQEYRYTVVATDAENDAITYSFVRRPEGMVIDDRTGVITWKPSFTGTYEVQVQVRDSQGASGTQTFQIVVGNTAVNQAPVITSTPVFVADTARAYQYQVTAVDPDAGDTLTYEIISAPSGMTINSATGLLTWGTPVVGAHQVVVGVRDSRGLGTAQGFMLTARANQAPTLSSSNPPRDAIPGVEYAYDVIARDPDGGKLTYKLDDTSLGKGITIDPLGRVRWTPNSTHLGNHDVTITVTDDAGATLTQNFTITVAPDTVAPTVKLGFAGTNPAEVGQTVYYRVQATDNVKVSNIELTVDGQKVAVDKFGNASFKLDRAGVVQAIATVTDASGNVSTDTFTIDVYDPNVPQNAPVVRLDLGLIPNGLITRVTELRGLVDDPDDNLSSYKLEVAPDGTNNWFTMFTVVGREVASGGVLGKFDPTVLDDGVYTVRLSARDTSGLESSISGQIEVVSGNLKFGEFQLSFTDMQINVGNIPVQLIRTYDSLKTNVPSADMAPGWRVEFRDVDLRTSLGKMTEEEEFMEEAGYYNRNRGLKEGDKIYLTIGGKREVFQIRLVPAEREGLQLPRLFDLVFDPVGNTKSRLSLTGSRSSNMTFIAQGDGTIRNLAGIPLDFSSQFSMSYFNTKLLLIGEDNLQYEINPANGKIDRIGTDLYRVRRRLTGSDVITTNANPSEYLELADTYIRSSYGAQITFERDSQGRIVAAVDPDGNKVRYSYDSNGDLVSVTDRMGNTTRFEYDARRKHYLSKIIDPLNRPAMRNEYDEMGRLTKVFDANGNAINSTYDPNNQIMVVTNALGEATVFEYDSAGREVRVTYADSSFTSRTYDSRGNILTETNELGYTTTYEYDANDRLISEADALGRRRLRYHNGLTQTFVDALGNVANVRDNSQGSYVITDPNGTVYSVNDASSDVVVNGVQILGNQEKDSLGRVTKYVAKGSTYMLLYDNHGRVTQEKQLVTTPSGLEELTSTFEYDKEGRLLKQTTSNGRVLTYEYDQLGRVISEAVNGYRVTMTYDSVGNLTKRTYWDGTTETFSYDVLGRKLSESTRDGLVINYRYDSRGRVSEISYGNGLTESFVYDRTGRVIRKTELSGVVYEYTYDAVGNVLTMNSSDGGRETLVYDAENRVSKITSANGDVLEFAYDASGQLVGLSQNGVPLGRMEYAPYRSQTRIDVAGNRTKVEVNELGLVTAVVDAEGRRTEYTYNELGWLTSIKDANGNITRYEYNLQGHRTAKVFADGSRETYTHNDQGLPTGIVRVDGTSVSQSYDPSQRQLVTTWSNGLQETVKFNANGQVILQQSATHIATFAYDDEGRLISSTDINGFSTNYYYDSSGRLIKTVSNGITVEYSYDSSNRITRINDSLMGSTSYTYDSSGRLSQVVLANGYRQNYTYDTRGQLSKIVYVNDLGSLVFSQEYTRDLVGNVTRLVESSGREVRYEYDRSYRLVSEVIVDPIQGHRTITYSYDATGNRLTRNDSVEGTTFYTYDHMNRLLSKRIGALETTYTYDARGNLISAVDSDGKRTLYSWSIKDELQEVVVRDGSNQVTYHVIYHYDENGMRVGKTENGVRTNFLLDYSVNGALLPKVRAEYDQSGNLIRAYNLSPISPGPLSQYDAHINQTLFYLSDRTGSTRKVVDGNGNELSKYEYDAYGRIIRQIGAVSIEYLYNGESYNPSTGLQYLRARYLDINTGRFISRDAYEGDLDNPLSQHAYHYANLNPVMYSDPTGYWSILETQVVQKIQSILQNIYSKWSVKKTVDYVQGISDVIFIGLLLGATAGLYFMAQNKIGISFAFKVPPYFAMASKTYKDGEVEIRFTPDPQKNNQTKGKLRYSLKTKGTLGFGGGTTAYFELDWSPLFVNGGGTLDFPFFFIPKSGDYKGSLLELAFKIGGSAGLGQGQSGITSPTMAFYGTATAFIEAKIVNFFKIPFNIFTLKSGINLNTGEIAWKVEYPSIGRFALSDASKDYGIL